MVQLKKNKASFQIETAKEQPGFNGPAQDRKIFSDMEVGITRAIPSSFRSENLFSFIIFEVFVPLLIIVNKSVVLFEKKLFIKTEAQISSMCQLQHHIFRKPISKRKIGKPHHTAHSLRLVYKHLVQIFGSRAPVLPLI